MPAETYELVALGMRYWFVLLGVIIVVRAARLAIRDYQCQEQMLRTLPDAGLIGEVVDLDTGESYPLPREGSLGSARSCDICLKGVRKRELEFSLVEGQGVVLLPSHRRHQVVLDGETIPKKAWALHGSHISLPGYHLRFRLFSGLDIPVATSTTHHNIVPHDEEQHALSVEDMSVLGEMGPLLQLDVQPPSMDDYGAETAVYTKERSLDTQMTWAYAVPPTEWFEGQVQFHDDMKQSQQQEQPRNRRAGRRGRRHDS